MKRIFFCLFTCILAFAMVTPGTAEAKAKSNSKAPATPTPPKKVVIKSVSADSITIDTGNGQKSYTIKKDTTVMVNGMRASASDLKPGMLVSVTTSGFEVNVAASISARGGSSK